MSVPMPQASPQGGDPLLKLLVVGTGCLCLLIVVVGVMLLIAMGKLDAQLLGQATTLGVGGGIVALAGIIFLTIRTGLGRSK